MNALVQWCHHYSAKYVYVQPSVWCQLCRWLVMLRLTVIQSRVDIFLFFFFLFQIMISNSVVTGLNRDHQIFVWRNGESLSTSLAQMRHGYSWCLTFTPLGNLEWLSNLTPDACLWTVIYITLRLFRLSVSILVWFCVDSAKYLNSSFCRSSNDNDLHRLNTPTVIIDMLGHVSDTG